MLLKCTCWGSCLLWVTYKHADWITRANVQHMLLLPEADASKVALRLGCRALFGTMRTGVSTMKALCMKSCFFFDTNSRAPDEVHPDLCTIQILHFASNSFCWARQEKLFAISVHSIWLFPVHLVTFWHIIMVGHNICSRSSWAIFYQIPAHP